MPVSLKCILVSLRYLNSQVKQNENEKKDFNIYIYVISVQVYFIETLVVLVWGYACASILLNVDKMNF